MSRPLATTYRGTMTDDGDKDQALRVHELGEDEECDARERKLPRHDADALRSIPSTVFAENRPSFSGFDLSAHVGGEVDASTHFATAAAAPDDDVAAAQQKVTMPYAPAPAPAAPATCPETRPDMAPARCLCMRSKARHF